MSRIRGFAILVVLVLLAASAAQALPLRPAPAPADPAGFLVSLWSWVTGLLAPDGNGAHGVVSVKAAVIDENPQGEDESLNADDQGPKIDPKDKRLPPGDAGGEMDPNG